jgi:hypothetical protein
MLRCQQVLVRHATNKEGRGCPQQRAQAFVAAEGYRSVVHGEHRAWRGMTD